MPPAKNAIKNLQKLKQFFLDNGPTCVHKPEGKLKYPYVTPTYAIQAGGDDKADVPERSTVGHYLQMYDWDACFFSQAAHRVGVRDLAPSVVANFLSLKERDGYVPRTVSPQRIWDAGDMCKPFLCQSLVRNDDHKSNPKVVDLIQDLECYLGYYIRNRQDASGLFHWRNVLESGVDDNFALLAPVEAAKDENEGDNFKYPDGELLAVDLSTYLACEFLAFSEICAAAGNTQKAAEYQKKGEEVIAAIEKHMWSEKHNMYFNCYPKTFKHVEIFAWTGLDPVAFSISKADRAEQVIRKTIASAEHFLRPCGLSSVAISEPLYNNSKRGLYGRARVSNWQGPMWILPNALVCRGLLKYGFKNEAAEIAGRVATTMINGLEATGTLYENYSAETGEPLWAPKFMSWNILTMELIELLES